MVGPRSTEPAVLWLTGLSGAGKSSIAADVCNRLRSRGLGVEYLDGDAIRTLFPQTGFTRSEREIHVRYVGFLASRLEHHGLIVVCALISPYRSSREDVRRMARRFIEIHVCTSLEECERRDPKGLYRRARAGEITHFTGIDDPYEPPDNPELSIDTAQVSVAEASDRVVETLLAPVTRAAVSAP